VARAFEPPTLDTFLHEAAAWRADASAHRDGVAIVYFSGHGFIVSRADQLVLLQNYGDGVGSILRNAINVGSIFHGMAPTSWTPEIARTQLYFVDTGQTFQALPPELGASAPTQVFDLPPDPGTDRVAITFSPAPGTVAYGELGGLSIFGAGLLECLDGSAAEQGAAGEWGVTTLGLVRALPRAVHRQIAKYADEQVSQEVTAGGLIGPAVVLRLPGPPEADLTIAVPTEATSSAVVTVRDSAFAPVFTRGPGVDRSLHIRLPAGLYVVELTESDRPPTLETLSLQPSAANHLVLERAK